MKIQKFKNFAGQCLIILALFMFGHTKLSAQQKEKITISGIVTDAKGEPVIATVMLKGSATIGASTDIDGKYTLQSIPVDGVLVFSGIGMENQEVNVNNSKTIDVVLKVNSIMLEETVVMGYGSVRKSDLTGSVSSVKTEILNNTPANSIEGLLQGRAAGLQVINTSQDPGAGSVIRIRGGSSLRGSNAPLIVVDGFPLGEAGNLKQINSEDIVSVEVLKDASAAAIYGSRGANGVIMVTTKKAKAGTTTVSLKQQTTLSQFTSKLVQWENPALMAQLNNESRINGGLPPIFIGATNSNGVYYPSVTEIEDGTWPYFTRWDKVVFRDTPVSNNTSASVNSANEKTSFNLSLNYFDEEGVYIKDDFTKGIVKLGVDHKIFENFTIRTSNIFSKNFRNNNGGLAYYRNPLWPVFKEDGSYFLAGNNDFSHPLAITDHVTNKTQGLDYISSWMLDWQITKNLNVKSQVNYKYGTYITDKYSPKKYTEAGEFNNGEGYIGNWKGENVVSETYLTYDKLFGKIHKINIMAGHSYEEGTARGSEMWSRGFVNEALGNENMAAGEGKITNANSYSKTKLLSFMGRINYSLNDKYLLTLTMRTDASSKFGINNKWAYFPSGALSWKAHQENFIKDLNIFDELKFRASYGVSGNQGISPYQTLSRYGTEQYFDDGKWKTAIGPGYVIGSEGDNYRFKVWGGIPNPNLKWETTSQYNIGVDMAFFKRRLRLTLDAYVKNTTDLLRESILSLSSGYNRMWVNDGEIRNQGFELSLEGDIISNRDFNLSGSFIFSKNKNKVISLGNEVTSGLNSDPNTGMKYEYFGSSLSNFSQTPNILAIGQAVNVFYGYKVDGIIQTEAEGLAAGLTGDLAKPGEFKYVDLDKNGVFDSNDRTIIGDPNPDFMASLGINGNYKNFDFEVFFNGVFGNDILYQNMWGGQANTMPLRWTLDNPNNEYPSVRDGRSYYLSDWYVKDGSFIRLQSVSIGYTYSPRKIKWLNWVSKARLSVNGSNLYTFTNFEGYDPEVGMNGIYWGGYPRLRNLTFGLEITF